MRFTKNDVRLVQIRQFKSQKGNLLTFLKVADKATFDSVEVLAAQDFDVMSVHEGSDYDLILDYDGRRIFPICASKCPVISAWR